MSTFRIAGVELEPWEQEQVTQVLGPGVYSDKHLAEAGDLGDPEVLLIFIYSPITREVLQKLPSLKLIATLSTGFDHIDLEACRERNIIVVNVPTYGEHTVAEHALALLLALTKKIVPSVDRTRGGNFKLDGLRTIDLFGKTAGIIGTGRIGQRFIGMVKGLGMKVIAYDPYPNNEVSAHLGFTYVPIEELLQRSDVVSLHAPATPDTFHLLDVDTLDLMKSGSYLINTARGSLIDTQALVTTLREGKLAGVGLDVLEEECSIREEKQLLSGIFQKNCDLKTLLADHMLLEQSNVIITPHNAFNSQEALQRILQTTIENVRAWESGQPKNVIS